MSEAESKSNTEAIVYFVISPHEGPAYRICGDDEPQALGGVHALERHLENQSYWFPRMGQISLNLNPYGTTFQDSDLAKLPEPPEDAWQTGRLNPSFGRSEIEKRAFKEVFRGACRFCPSPPVSAAPRSFARIFSEPHSLANRFSHSKLIFVFPIHRELTLRLAQQTGAFHQAERSPMPELRQVVLALQDRLVYGPTFDAAMRAMFGNETSSVSMAAPCIQAISNGPASTPDLLQISTLSFPVQPKT
jgi:hypothetical protein